MNKIKGVFIFFQFEDITLSVHIVIVVLWIYNVKKQEGEGGQTINV